MKFLMLGALLFSSSVFACPDLSGSYTCVGKTRSYQKEVQKTDTGYISSNDGIEYEYFTDGKVYDIPETDSYRDGKLTSTCNGDQFIVDLTMTVLYEGAVVGQQVSHTTYNMEGDKLIINQKVKMKKIPLPKQKFICTRN